MENSKLAVFDFDYTIINANSTTYLNKLVIERSSSDTKKLTPSIAILNKYKYPNEIETLVNKKNPTIRQNEIYKHMFNQFKINKNDMVKCLSEIKISQHMVDLFSLLNENNFNLMVISDSNTFLIETILKSNRLESLFESRIISNQAVFSDDGYLNLIPFNKVFLGNEEIFRCENETCRENMCKGMVLEAYIREKRSKEVIYVGDGCIDFCPGVKLGENDSFYVKKISSLSRLLENESNIGKIKARIKYWKNGKEIIDQL